MVPLNENFIDGVDRFGLTNRHVFFLGTSRQHLVNDIHVLFNWKHKCKTDVVFFIWNFVTNWNIVRFVTKTLYPLRILTSHLTNPGKQGWTDKEP